jgi:hypothetical protein
LTVIGNPTSATQNPFSSKGCSKGKGTRGISGTEGAEGAGAISGTEETHGIKGKKGTKGSKGTKGTEGTKGTKGHEGQLEPRDIAPRTVAPLESPGELSEAKLAETEYAWNQFLADCSKHSLLQGMFPDMLQLEAPASFPHFVADDVAAKPIAVEESTNESTMLPSQELNQSTAEAIELNHEKWSSHLNSNSNKRKSLLVLNFPSTTTDDELLHSFTGMGFQVKGVCGKSSTANLNLANRKSAFAFVNCPSTKAASSLKHACDEGKVVLSGKDKDWILKADWAKRTPSAGKRRAKKHRGSMSSGSGSFV